MTDDRTCGCGHDGPEGHCRLCHENHTGTGLLDHIRIMHPDAWGDGPQRWPDGKPVIVDTTLDPKDFLSEEEIDTMMATGEPVGISGPPAPFQPAPRPWYGINAAGGPLVAHRLNYPYAPRAVRESTCRQERRSSWQPVEDFADPAAFTRCADCAMAP
jgi:hypothetical protein